MLRHTLLLLSCAALGHAFAPPSRRFSKEQFRLAAEPEYDENASFQDLGLNPEALTAIRAQQGWTTPTPIQQLVIPKLLDLAAEEDGSESSHADSVWCEAPTGSGKTAAYALPLLQNLKSQPQQEGARIASLILCPTRELADQIGSVVTNLASNMSTKKSRKLNIMTIYGGTRMEPQIAELADYARNGETLDVLIATPGRMVDVLTYYQSEAGDSSAVDAAFERRLLDAMEQTKSESLSLETIKTMKLDRSDHDGRGALINLLADLQYFVLDEADRLLGRAFESEMDKVMELLPSKVQTWLFSATFPNHIEPRVDQVLKRIGATTPIRISCANSDRLVTEDVSSSLAKRLERASTAGTAAQVQQVGPASTIQLRTIRLETPARTQALRLLLEEHPEWDRVLVFVATRYSAEHVARKLRKAGIGAAELHGKLDQDARTRRLEDLKRGKVRVLLATDVASRGLDIVGLPVMINYDLPRSTADFVHRVGRTGRAGRSGTAITFVTPSSVGHLDLIETRHLKESVEREILPGFEPNEERWEVEAQASKISAPGTQHSDKGLVHDRMFGGIKSRRKSKKDKLREKAVKEAAKQGAVE